MWGKTLYTGAIPVRASAEMLELVYSVDLKSTGDFLHEGSTPSLGTRMGAWRSWLARHVDIVEVIGSTPIAPTSFRVRFRRNS